MKNIEINMSDIGFGANRLGIKHGYVMIKDRKPALYEKINYVPYDLLPEDMTLTNKKFYNTVYEASVNIYNASLKSFAAGKLPLTLGGDHSLALGSIKASMKANEGEDIGLIWIDAHADINTFEISDSGNIHGMPVSGLLGINDEKYNNLGNDLRIKPENMAYVATRDVDYNEEILINKYGILNYSDSMIEATSFDACLEAIVNHLKGKVKKVHISLDLDSINPKFIKGVSTPVVGGLTLDEPLRLFKKINESFEIVGIDIVEYNPLTDVDEKTLNFVDELITDIEKI